MAHYDFDRGMFEINPTEIFTKYVQPIATRLDGRTFDKMIRTVDTELAKLKPSQKSQLTWTRCAALCGYQSDAPTKSTNHLWTAAESATTFDPDGANKFVGSLIMWRISLLPDTWISAKSKDDGAIHPYRSYWINNKFVPPRNATAKDLAAHFNGNRV